MHCLKLAVSDQTMKVDYNYNCNYKDLYLQRIHDFTNEVFIKNHSETSGTRPIILYFMITRPEQKRRKEEKSLRENLKVGDEIVTIGGIYGKIISLKEDTMVVESKSDHSKLTFARWALQQNLTVHDDAPKKK